MKLCFGQWHLVGWWATKRHASVYRSIIALRFAQRPFRTVLADIL
jgi:hypothetical protein